MWISNGNTPYFQQFPAFLKAVDNNGQPWMPRDDLLDRDFNPNANTGPAVRRAGGQLPTPTDLAGTTGLFLNGSLWNGEFHSHDHYADEDDIAKPLLLQHIGQSHHSHRATLRGAWWHCNHV